MRPSEELQREVEQRAGGRCEYCCMHQALQGATFHVEHIIPRSRGGETTQANLAWACPGCNLRKSDRIEGVDPLTGEAIRLYNPRTDKWSHHFRWEGYDVVPLTGVGRVTVAALDLNHPRRLQIRRVEQLFDLFPPER